MCGDRISVYVTLSFSMTSSLTITVEDLQKGHVNRDNEVWLKAGRRFSVPVLINSVGVVLCWEFTTQPKVRANSSWVSMNHVETGNTQYTNIIQNYIPSYSTIFVRHNRYSQQIIFLLLVIRTQFYLRKQFNLPYNMTTINRHTSTTTLFILLNEGKCSR